MTTIHYTPPPTVNEFIQHYKPRELFTDWIVGPVGSGKTTGIFMKLIHMAGLQERSPIDGIRRSRCVVVRSTASQLADTTIKSFNYWFKDGTAGKWHATPKNFILRFGDVECEVMFRPLDTPEDIDRVLSLEVTFAIVDEFIQLPRPIIDALSARCGRYPPEIEGGATNWGMWGASNPGNESDWWYAMLEDHGALPEGELPPENWKYFVQPSGFSADAENTDNLPGKREYYTNLAKGKTKHWIKQFIEVCWGFSLSGKPVFPMFDRDLHVSKKPLTALRGLPIAIGYDPGMHSGIILGQYNAYGQARILDEIVLEGFSTERMISERLKPLLRTKYPSYEVVLIPDPSSVNRAQAVDSSVMKVLRKHFVVVEDSNNQIETRLAPAQHYMMTRTMAGESLQIDPSCIKLIRALGGGYKYTVTKAGETQGDTPAKNLHSNIADAFTYLLRYFRKGEEKAGRREERPRSTQRRTTNYNMK